MGGGQATEVASPRTVVFLFGLCEEITPQTRWKKFLKGGEGFFHHIIFGLSVLANDPPEKSGIVQRS